jgi:hypothetical protein
VLLLHSTMAPLHIFFIFCIITISQGSSDHWIPFSPNTTAFGAQLYSERCNIERRQNLSVSDFLLYQMRSIPVIVERNPQDSALFQQLCEKEHLTEYYGSRQVILSTANSFSHNKLSTSLSDYLNNMMHAQDLSIDGATTYLLFGDNSDEDWKDLLDHYKKPKYPYPEGSLSWGIAGSGTGVPFHHHGAVFNEVIHGLKRWFLYPPDITPEFHEDQTTLYWLLNVYPYLSNKALLLECVLGPNEMLFLPSFWWHATLNVGETVNIATFI